MTEKREGKPRRETTGNTIDTEREGGQAELRKGLLLSITRLSSGMQKFASFQPKRILPRCPPSLKIPIMFKWFKKKKRT